MSNCKSGSINEVREREKERSVRSSNEGVAVAPVPCLEKPDARRREAHVRSPAHALALSLYLSLACSVDQRAAETNARMGRTNVDENDAIAKGGRKKGGKGKREREREKLPRRETTYVLRRAPSGYSMRRCTFVPPLYFGSKNAATRPVVTRVSRGSSFSRHLSFSLSPRRVYIEIYTPFSVYLPSVSSDERRLRAFALTAFQFVRIPLRPSLVYARYRAYILSLSPFLFILDRPLPSVRVHPSPFRPAPL